MVLETKAFKDVCSLILGATDANELSTTTEVLELVTYESVLYMSVTNEEYFASVKFDLDHDEEFHATVNATLFLKLIAAVTTEHIELEVIDNYLMVRANGNYKLPLVFKDNQMMELEVISIENPTVEMNVSSDILDSILNYNSKEIAVGTLAAPVQKMFYLDQQGCITFTTGACVNSFDLEKSVKVLLNSRLVKLFKLFKGQMVKFTLGYDAISETIVQTKVSFSTDKIKLTAITSSDDTLLNSVPVRVIRERASKSYPHSVTVNKEVLLGAISRLLLFSSGYGAKENIRPNSVFKFADGTLTLYDANEENLETISYTDNSTDPSEYVMKLNLVDFKRVLDSCCEQFVTLNFGDMKACVIVHNAIRNVLPEVRGKQQ